MPAGMNCYAGITCAAPLSPSSVFPTIIMPVTLMLMTSPNTTSPTMTTMPLKSPMNTVFLICCEVRCVPLDRVPRPESSDMVSVRRGAKIWLPPILPPLPSHNRRAVPQSLPHLSWRQPRHQYPPRQLLKSSRHNSVVWITMVPCQTVPQPRLVLRGLDVPPG
jgi:hypothetical protein